MKKHVFEAFLSLQNEKNTFLKRFSVLKMKKTRFLSAFKFTKWKKHVFDTFSNFAKWKSTVLKRLHVYNKHPKQYMSLWNFLFISKIIGDGISFTSDRVTHRSKDNFIDRKTSF